MNDGEPPVTMWGGRFGEPPSDLLWSYTVDHADRRLLADDVSGSLAHARMLVTTGLIDPDEGRAMTDGLERILTEAREGRFEFRDSDEDVHSAVERRLGELAGPVAGKLHTGRSRNDQVALDLRLYLRRAAGRQVARLGEFAGMLATRAGELAGVVVAAYTHLQQAQAVSLGHHLLAYGWMAVRDAERLAGAGRRLAVSPLGAGPGGGSGLPIDPYAVAAALDLPAVFENSLDAVSSRDVVAEYVFCCAQAMVTLSRLSEELVLWATTEFGWVTYADALTTGSSALPHKKNPDIAELARGRAAGVIGDLTALLALQKGLPLAYNRDLQEDKRLVFHADDTLGATLEAVGALVASARFHPPAPSPWVGAFDVAEHLTGLGVPFREAHARVGRLVAGLEGDGRNLAGVTADELAGLHPDLRPEDVADPAASAARRVTPGGGAPALVAGQVEALRERIARLDEQSTAG